MRSGRSIHGMSAPDRNAHLRPTSNDDELSDFAPVLAAFYDSDIQWEVWCPSCEKWHGHPPGNAYHPRGGCTGFQSNGKLARWPNGYWISDAHPDFNSGARGYRPNLEPIGWKVREKLPDG